MKTSVGGDRSLKKRGAKDSKKTIKRLLSYITEKHTTAFIFVIVCVVVASISQIIGIMFLEDLIDNHVIPLTAMENPVFTGLFNLLVIIAVIHLVGAIANLIHNIAMVNISQAIQKRIRDQMFAHMQKLPIKYFDTHPHGDVMSRYTNDIEVMRDMLSRSLPQLFASAMLIGSAFIAMLYTDIFLTGIAILSVFAVSKVTKVVTSKSGEYFAKQQASVGEGTAYIEEMMHGQKVVKVFCYEEESKKEFDRINEKLCENSTNANSHVNILAPIITNIGYLLYVIIAIVAGFMVITGFSGLTVGAMVSFLQLSRTFSQPMTQIAMLVNSVVSAIAGAERIFEVLDETPEVDNGNVTLVNAKYEGDSLVEVNQLTNIWAWKKPEGNGKTTLVPLKGDVRFFNVNFGYSEEKLVLHDVSIYAKPGQKLAFVGSTGAGKTTITNLINRFYDIADGNITYDGININEIKKSDLRHSLGIVLQDTHLFTGTILENIRYGKLNATEEEVKAAAKSAHAHEFISMLPDGYNTVISGDGSSLSQGQRQLLSIARAKVANLPVMILDEATSSIDTRTESIVQRGMDSLMQGRTVFVIAHRLSTVQNSNAIIVLEHGKIIERGDHDQLIAEKGKYHQLYTGSFHVE